VKSNIVRTQAVRVLIMERNARRAWFALTRHETEGTSEATALVNCNLWSKFVLTKHTEGS